MLIAFLHALCQGGDSVKIQLSPSFELSLKPWTNIYHSDFGYTEPKELDRHNILDIENGFSDEDGDELEPVEVENA